MHLLQGDKGKGSNFEENNKTLFSSLLFWGNNLTYFRRTREGISMILQRHRFLLFVVVGTILVLLVVVVIMQLLAV